jgi:hypothetical protein
MGTPSIGSHEIAYDDNGNPVYEGWAKRKGANKSSAIWKIKKYVWELNGSNYVMTRELWADGNELYDNVWNNRESLNYS